MSFASSRRWAFRETLRGLERNAGSFVFSAILAALAISIPLFIFCICYGLSEPLRNVPTAVEIIAFTTQKADTETLLKEVSALSAVEDVRIVPRDAAFRELNESLGIKTSKNERNPLPDILIATLEPSVRSDEIESAALAVEKLPGVDFVSYEATWHEKLHYITKAANTGLLCIGAVVLSLVILVLAAAIRMTCLSASDQMRALHLFGASPSFAIRPYAWRGILLMVIASGLAMLITQGGIVLFGHAVARVAALYGTRASITLPPVPWLIGIVAALGVMGGIVASLAAADIWRQIRR